MRSIILFALSFCILSLVNAKSNPIDYINVSNLQPITKSAVSINGKWELINWKSKKDSLSILFDKKWPHLEIDSEKLFVLGYNGCNTFRGQFYLKNDSVSFKLPMASTMMACSGNSEQLFMALLQQTNRQTINKGLLNFYEGKKLLMQFKRKE
jgi:heat shock protein HslJ